MNDYNEIAARLRELREVSDYTVEELAAELRISPEGRSRTDKKQGWKQASKENCRKAVKIA